jgi:hypothetical protein
MIDSLRYPSGEFDGDIAHELKMKQIVQEHLENEPLSVEEFEALSINENDHLFFQQPLSYQENDQLSNLLENEPLSYQENDQLSNLLDNEPLSYQENYLENEPLSYQENY